MEWLKGFSVNVILIQILWRTHLEFMKFIIHSHGIKSLKIKKMNASFVYEIRWKPKQIVLEVVELHLKFQFWRVLLEFNVLNVYSLENIIKNSIKQQKTLFELVFKTQSKIKRTIFSIALICKQTILIFTEFSSDSWLISW